MGAQDPKDRFAFALDGINYAAERCFGYELEGKTKSEKRFIRSEIQPYAEYWYCNGDLALYKFWCQHPEVRKRPIEEKRRFEALADRIRRAEHRDDQERGEGNANADHELRDELSRLSRKLGDELRAR